MSNFRWHRKLVTPSTYYGKFDGDKSEEVKDFSLKERVKSNGQKEYVLSDDVIALFGTSKKEKAYEVASDIRKFEIGLFWQRAAYFWAFITVIYAAYFQVLTELYEKDHGHFALVILSALGVFFSFSWYLSSKASKHWQENWELHLDLLEDDVTGSLYKTYLAEKSYSVSKINIFAGIAVTICSFGLLMYDFAVFANEKLHLSGLLGVAICSFFALLSLFSLFVYAKLSEGNSKATGETSLQEKSYER